MPNQQSALIAEVARLKRELAQVKKGQRIAHGASIENAAVEVRDDTGSLRAIVGQQGDGTTGAIIVNGPPPPEPSAPVVVSVLGGVTVTWDGEFAGGAVIPLDWARVEVHASTEAVYDPTPATLHSTIETAQGATVVVATDDPVYVRLLARSTSGTASVPSVTVGPYGPTPVVATDILDGIVTTIKLADDAVTAAKVALAAVTPEALSAVLSDSVSQRWVDTLDDPAAWSATLGTGAAWSLTPLTGAPSGGTVGQASGYVTARGTTLIPYDPSTLYRVSVRIRASAQPLSGPDTLYAGVIGVAADKTTLVNRAGADSAAGQFYCLASNLSLPSASGWQVLTGYLQGRAASGVSVPGSTAPSPLTPALLHDQVRYIAPYLLLNYGLRDPAGVMQVDSFSIEAVRTGVVTAEFIAANQINAGHIVAGAVTTAKLDALAVNAGKLAAGAVTTDKLDALAVTADKIAANAITVGKLAAGAVDTTALDADAITGMTITGGSITGTVLQTATTGPRVAINESSSNGITVNDGTREVASLDAAGLELTGANGASLTLNPNFIYPTILLSSENGTNSAYINAVADTPGDANLGLNCGPFTADSQVMRWRQYFGNDFFVAERFLDSDPAVLLGGRIDLRKDFAAFGYYDTDGATQSADLVISSGLAQIQGRLSVQPTLGDSSSVLLAQSGTGHTGFLMRLYNTAAAAYRFQVDLAGNTNISGILTAASRAQGTTTITPSAAHTPTSMLVTYNVAGTTFRGYATAQTTVPGVRTPVGAGGVTGVSVSSVTATSMLVWVNRENTTATNVNWSVEAS